ncbi:MAG: sulfatase [Bacteroidales bacterium]
MNLIDKKTLLFSSLCFSGSFGFAQSPNLVFIMADQWRGDALGCLGIEPVRTPNLDKLASEGVLFTEAVSGYPVSSPARAMLMTGMYPMKNRVTSNCNSATAPYGVEMDEKAECWSDVLRKRGYDLGYLGKWHLDSPRQPYVDTYNNRGGVAWNEWCPKERRHGFDFWIAYGTYDYHLRPMYWNADASREEFYYVEQWGPEFEADRAIEYICNESGDLRQHDNPFALVISMNPPHTGYDLVPDRYKALYRDLDVEKLAAIRPAIPAAGTENGDYFRKNIRDYYACMTGVDEQVGRVVDALKKQGLFENTVLVFTSDHGICMGAYEEAGKDRYYDEAMKVPMIITYPEKLKPRRDTSLMLAYADLYPSLLALMGFEKEIPDEVQTMNLADYIVGKKKNPEIVQPYYKIDPKDNSTGYRGIRTGRYTLAIHATKGKVDEWVLFDRVNDPAQLNNIAGENPKLVKHLTRDLKKFLQKTDDPFASYL